MAMTSLKLLDTYFKTIVKLNINGANSGPSANIVNVSGLVGYVSKAKSRVSLVSVTWSVSTPIDIQWAGANANTCLSLQGNGMYGGSDGFPPIIYNNTTSSITAGDLELTSTNPCLGFFVCILHKVPAAGYDGIAWEYD